MSDNSILVRHADVLEADVDGQRVLMSPKGYVYFGLEGTGALVWDRINGITDVHALSVALAAEFDADIDQIRSDVDEFVSALAAAGLLDEA